MKKMFFMGMIGVLLLGSLQLSYAYTYTGSYSGAWFQTDDDDWFGIEIQNQNVEFGIFDWATKANSLTLFPQAIGIDAVRVKVWESSPGVFQADVSDLLYNPVGTLQLGNSDYFGLYFGTFSGPVTYSINGSTDWSNYSNWLVSYGTPGSVTTVSVSDAAPVPIPPSAALLGFGLLGFVGFGLGRRKRNA